MLELGEGAASGHREVGTAAAATCDLLVVVGAGASGIAIGARERRPGADRASITVAIAMPRSTCAPRASATGDVVLVKASRGVELDLLVDALRADLARNPR